MNTLFSPFQLKNLEIRNRIVMPPMCMYSTDATGMAQSWHALHYETRALGGAGLIIVEATAVQSCGRITDRDLGIWSGEHIGGLSEIVKRIKHHGAAAGIQLAHAGRKCTVKSERIIAPSSLVFDAKDPAYSNPAEMTREDIKGIIHDFREGARRAREAGFDFIEVHGAHGYLLNEFLTPVVNKRTDDYGGTPENRARLVKEVIQAVRQEWSPENPLALRVSAKDYVDGGNEPEDLAVLIDLVKETGIDMVHVSSGGVVPDAVIEAFPGFQIPAAALIKEKTGLPVIAGGLISAPRQADEIIRNQRADMVFLGRELLRNPYWTYAAAKELKQSVDYRPVQYERAYL